MTDDGRLDTWQRLLRPECEDLLEQIPADERITPAALARLRRDFAADLVSAAFDLVRARRRAASKLPGVASLVADLEGVEQASSLTVARHKALRFGLLGPVRIFDLCCGIGIDALALAEIAPVVAVDRDPLRAWMTARNAGCATRVADVRDLELDGEIVHIDPDRRTRGPEGGRRLYRYEDYEPGPDVLEALIARNPDAAIKLGPGIAIEALPHAGEREIEIIGENGTLVQAVLWTGRLATRPGRRTASRLPGGHTLSGTPAPPPPADGPIFDRFLHVPDPAVERAELLGCLCDTAPLAAPVPALGLLTSPEPVESPWIDSFEILADLPWRPRRVKTWLEEHQGGVVEIKTRGGVVDPDRVQGELRGTGPERYTVFVLRLERNVRAFVTRRSGRVTPTRASAAPAAPPG